MIAKVKGVYSKDQDGEKYVTKKGTPYRALVLEEEGDFEDDEGKHRLNVFRGDHWDKVNDLENGERVQVELDKSGSFTNLNKIIRLKNQETLDESKEKPKQTEKKEEQKDISKMFEKKQNYRWKELAFEVIKMRQKMYQEIKYDNADDFNEGIKDEIKEMAKELKKL